MKKFKDSRLFAIIVINLIMFLVVVLNSFYDNLLGSFLVNPSAKNLHNFWQEIFILETPAFIIINGAAIIETWLDHRDKKKQRSSQKASSNHN